MAMSKGKVQSRLGINFELQLMLRKQTPAENLSSVTVTQAKLKTSATH